MGPYGDEEFQDELSVHESVNLWSIEVLTHLKIFNPFRLTFQL